MQDIHGRLGAGLEDAMQVRHSPACSRTFASPRTRAPRLRTPPYRCMRLGRASRWLDRPHIHPHSYHAAGAGQDRPRIHVSADLLVRRVGFCKHFCVCTSRLILTERHRPSTRYLQGMPVARIFAVFTAIHCADRSVDVAMQLSGCLESVRGAYLDDMEAEYLFPQRCCKMQYMDVPVSI